MYILVILKCDTSFDFCALRPLHRVKILDAFSENATFTTKFLQHFYNTPKRHRFGKNWNDPSLFCSFPLFLTFPFPSFLVSHVSRFSHFPPSSLPFPSEHLPAKPPVAGDLFNFRIRSSVVDSLVFHQVQQKVISDIEDVVLFFSRTNWFLIETYSITTRLKDLRPCSNWGIWTFACMNKERA